jgi:hypothetical protein
VTANDTYVYGVTEQPDVRRERLKRSDRVSWRLTQSRRGEAKATPTGKPIFAIS